MYEILKKLVGKGVQTGMNTFEQYLKDHTVHEKFSIERHDHNDHHGQFHLHGNGSDYNNIVFITFRPNSITLKWHCDVKSYDPTITFTVYDDHPTLAKNRIKEHVPNFKNLTLDDIDFLYNLNKVEKFA